MTPAFARTLEQQLEAVIRVAENLSKALLPSIKTHGEACSGIGCNVVVNGELALDNYTSTLAAIKEMNKE